MTLLSIRNIWGVDPSNLEEIAIAIMNGRQKDFDPGTPLLESARLPHLRDLAGISDESSIVSEYEKEFPGERFSSFAQTPGERASN